jgi:hypothetical protein
MLVRLRSGKRLELSLGAGGTFRVWATTTMWAGDGGGGFVQKRYGEPEYVMRDGSPSIVDPGERLSAWDSFHPLPPAGDWGIVLSAANRAPPTYTEILALPRETDELVETVREWAARPSDAENGQVARGAVLEERTFEVLTGLAADWPLPDDLAQALLAAALTLPDIEVVRGAFDPRGRPAIRISRVLDKVVGLDENVHVADAIRRDLFFDPESGQVIAWQDTVLSAIPGFFEPFPVGSIIGAAEYDAIELLQGFPAELPRAALTMNLNYRRVGSVGEPVMCRDPLGRDGDHLLCAYMRDHPELLGVREDCEPPGPTLAGESWYAQIDGELDGRAVHVRLCNRDGVEPFVAALGLGPPDAAFTARFSPTPANPDRCDEPAGFDCDQIATAAWYHAEITNTGADDAAVFCDVVARDTDGAELARGRVIWPFSGEFGNLWVGADETVALDGYL